MIHEAQRLPNYPEQPELALVAALTLISRYSSSHSPVLAEAALTQLRVVAKDDRFSTQLRQCAESLILFWQERIAVPVSTDLLH